MHAVLIWGSRGIYIAFISGTDALVVVVARWYDEYTFRDITIVRFY